MKRSGVTRTALPGVRASSPHEQSRAFGGSFMRGPSRPGRPEAPAPGNTAYRVRAHLEQNCNPLIDRAMISSLDDHPVRRDEHQMVALGLTQEVAHLTHTRACSRRASAAARGGCQDLHGYSQPPRLTWIPACAGMTPPRPVPSFPRKRESTGGHGVEFLYATAGAGSLTVAGFHSKGEPARPGSRAMRCSRIPLRRSGVGTS